MLRVMNVVFVPYGVVVVGANVCLIFLCDIYDMIVGTSKYWTQAVQVFFYSSPGEFCVRHETHTKYGVL